MAFELQRIVVKVLCIAFVAAAPPATHADIYKCIDEYGNVAYLQLPCPAEKADAPEAPDDADAVDADPERQPDKADLSPEPQTPAPQVPSSRRPGERLEDCKKRYRDQIDEIDAEMRVTFSPEQGELYKKKLQALTRQLRGCG